MCPQHWGQHTEKDMEKHSDSSHRDCIREREWNGINSQLRASGRSLMCRLRAPSCPARVCPARLSSSMRHKTKLRCRRQWLVASNTAFIFLSHCKSFSLSVTRGDTSHCHWVDGSNLAQGTNFHFDSQSVCVFLLISSRLSALATLGLYVT